ncbi:MAG: oxygen-independent coproporphyrinogen III oxidase [Planctomycetota bacterium]
MSSDLSALHHYEVQGPRYTSYPPAPAFSESYGVREFAHDLEHRDQGRDLSLYVHQPFCDTLCYFCGCNMKISNDRAVIAAYLESLETEIRTVRSLLKPPFKVRQMHWGGGTPTHLKPGEILHLARTIRGLFDFSPDAECSVEADPRGLGEDGIAALQEAGFNRISIGLQDFDEKVQKAVNRVHSAEMVGRLVGWVRRHGFVSLNFDLMYGLPHQNVQTFSRTLDAVLALGPDRLAVFNYAHLPHMIKHQKLIDETVLPTAAERLDILAMAVDRLERSGYVFIGMDHFAREGDPLLEAQRNRTLHRNFQGYSTHAGLDLIGFGASAISQLKGSYIQNVREPMAYREKVSKGLATLRGYRLTQDDALRREIIFSLMCHFEVDGDLYCHPRGLDFRRDFAQEIARLEPFFKDGCVAWEGRRLQVTPRGRWVIRNIAMCFDAHAPILNHGGQRFSRTV